jgi:hypothetical protein
MEAMFEPGYMQRDMSHLMVDEDDRPRVKQSQKPVADRGKTIIHINQVNNLTFLNHQ